MRIFGVRRVTRNFPGVATPPDPPTVFGTNQTCLPTSRFVQILPNMQYFSNQWSMQFFFTSGIGPDILMKVFEGYIIFLIWAASVLFKGFQSGALLNTISFHEEIWLITKALKNAGFNYATSSIPKTKNKKTKIKAKVVG